MLHGDISNCGGMVIGFRFENFLATEELGSGIRKPLNQIKKLVLPTSLLVPNQKAASVMMRMYRQTSFQVAVVLERKNHSTAVAEWLENHFLFGDMMLVENDMDVWGLLMRGELSYYVDDDIARRATIPSEYSVPLSSTYNIIAADRKR